jgi:hypothetical protein
MMAVEGGEHTLMIQPKVLKCQTRPAMDSQRTFDAHSFSHQTLILAS